MMDGSIKIKLPKELKELTNLSELELEKKSLQIWVMELYSEGKITQSKAANILNKKVDEFLELFYQRHYKHQAGTQSINEANSDLDVAMS